MKAEASPPYWLSLGHMTVAYVERGQVGSVSEAECATALLALLWAHSFGFPSASRGTAGGGRDTLRMDNSKQQLMGSLHFSSRYIFLL